MSLASSVPDTKNIRDIEADFLKATIAEYESYETAGSAERAAEVAAHLKTLGYDVKAKVAKPVADDVETTASTEEAPETAAEPAAKKPRATRAKKPDTDEE